MSTELSAALAAWTQSRDPAVGAAVRALSARALDGFAVPTGRTKAAFDAAWHDLASSDPSPEATGWLAAHLEDRLPNGPLEPPLTWEHYHAVLCRRIEVLALRCPDPRVADAAAELLEHARHSLLGRQLPRGAYRPALDLALRAGDPAVADRVAAAGTGSPSVTVREYLGAVAAPFAAALRTIPVAPVADAERWAALAKPRSSGPDLAPLLEALQQDPSSDAARAVLADAWLEHGDPRGEFVALQLLPAPTEVQGIRARKLLREHQAKWLGMPLSATLKRHRFERGFLDEAELSPTSEAAPEVWEEAARDPRLATVRVLRQGHGNRAHYRDFVLSPAMRDLRRVEIPVAALLEALADGPPRAIEAVAFRRTPPRRLLARLAGSAALARVRTLFVDSPDLPDLLEDLAAVGLDHRLAGLEVARGIGGPLVLPLFWELVERLPQLERVAIGNTKYSGGTDCVALLRGPDGWRLDAGDLISARFTLFGDEIPQGLVRATVTTNNTAPEQLRERLQREWGCPVEVRRVG